MKIVVPIAVNQSAPRRVGPLGSILLSLGLLGGCAIPARVTGIQSVSPSIGREMTPVVVDAGLKAIEDPAIQARMSVLLREASRELTPHVGPIAETAVRGAIRGAMSELSSAQSERALSHVVGAVVAGSVPPLAKGLAGVDLGTGVSTAMTSQIGPAFQKVLQDNLTPGFAEALEDARVQRAIGATVHVISKEIVLGSSEAMAELAAAKPPNDPPLIERVGKLTSLSVGLVRTATWSIAIIAVLVAAWVARGVLRRRQSLPDRDSSEKTPPLIHRGRQRLEGRFSGRRYRAVSRSTSMTEIARPERARSTAPPL